MLDLDVRNSSRSAVLSAKKISGFLRRFRKFFQKNKIFNIGQDIFTDIIRHCLFTFSKVDILQISPYRNFTFSKFLKKQKSILTLEFFSNRSKTAGFSLKMNSIRCCGSDFLRQIFLAIFSFNENQRNIFSFSDFWISDFQNSA